MLQKSVQYYTGKKYVVSNIRLILSNVTLLMKIGKETVNHSFIEVKEIVPSLLELI